jgi:hypothetical protein
MKPSTYHSILAAIFTTAASSASAAVVLASDFTGVSKSGNTASSFSWDTVNGTVTPTTSLSFVDPDNGNAALTFWNTRSGELDVNENIGTGGAWRTSFQLELNASTSTINLSTLDLMVSLLNGSGGLQGDASNKDGTYTFTVTGNTTATQQSAFTTIDYTSVTGQPVSIDLSGITLTDAESYTASLTLRRDNGNFGHHVSLDTLSLNGGIVGIPEPSVALLGGLGLLGLLRRRR